MLFDLIDRILFSKKTINNKLGDDPVHPYIINRWISMYSTELCTVINNTGNWLYSVFDDHDHYFKFLQQFIPRVANRRIYYIKKAKKQPDKPEHGMLENVDMLAHNLELSKREIKCLIEYERQHRPTCTD